ncbi:MAG: DUF1573 domain-containing protein [Taibaiella sp.]|nr:DUF1573 domain-containing protein [Taibaiella sp.]
MKRFFFSVCSIMCLSSIAFAQNPTQHQTVAPKAVATAPASATMKAEAMAFTTDTHEFGTVPEGPAAEYEFKFKNSGKEPIILQHVQASCGCTTPTYSKDPILPGKQGTIKASYNTQGRPGSFVKTITVVSNAGTKVLTIKGQVEKAPETSVPENNSMIRTN